MSVATAETYENHFSLYVSPSCHIKGFGHWASDMLQETLSDLANDHDALASQVMNSICQEPSFNRHVDLERGAHKYVTKHRLALKRELERRISEAQED